MNTHSTFQGVVTSCDARDDESFRDTVEGADDESCQDTVEDTDDDESFEHTVQSSDGTIEDAIQYSITDYKLQCVAMSSNASDDSFIRVTTHSYSIQLYA